MDFTLSPPCPPPDLKTSWLRDSPVERGWWEGNAGAAAPSADAGTGGRRRMLRSALGISAAPQRVC